MSEPEKLPVRIIQIGGVPVEIRSEEECDKCDWWICALVVPGQQRPMEKSQEDFCVNCGRAVWFDPRMNMSKPRKICTECVVKVVGKKPGEVILKKPGR